MPKKGQIYPQHLNLDDDYFLQKSVANQNLQYVSDLIRNNKRDMYLSITYTISLIITLLTAKYSNLLNLLQISLIIGCLILILSLLLQRDLRIRKSLLNNRNALKPGFKNLNLKWIE